MKNFFLFLLGLIIGAAAVYFYCCKTVDLAEGIVEPKGVISPEQAKTLDRAYNLRHQLISDSIVKRPDNRSSWYALDDVRNYLNFAEGQAKDLGYEMNGVRIYLGAHPDGQEGVGYTTMFFVPTGNQLRAKGSMFNYTFQDGDGGDIPGGSGLNMGSNGNPPRINYPQ